MPTGHTLVGVEAELVLASHWSPPGRPGQEWEWEQRVIAVRQSGQVEGWKFTDWLG